MVDKGAYSFLNILGDVRLKVGYTVTTGRFNIQYIYRSDASWRGSQGID